MKQRTVLYIVLLFALLNPGLKAQQALRGVVYDKESKKPLQGVVILFNYAHNELQTDSAGRFQLPAATGSQTYLFKRLGYTSSQIRLDWDSLNVRTLTVYMSVKPQNLQEVDIKADKLRPLVKNNRYYIDDYFILPGHHFFLATHGLGERGFSLSMADYNGRLYGAHHVENEDSSGFFLDCMGNLHVLSNKYDRQLFATSDTSFKCYDPTDLIQFKNIVKPCLAKVNKNIFFLYMDKPYNFEREGVTVHVNSSRESLVMLKDHKYHLVKNIRYSKATEDMKKEEVEFQNYRKWLSQNGYGIHYSPYDILVAYDCIYRTINAPVFVYHDSIAIVDISNEQIELYTQDGVSVNNVSFGGKSYSQYHEPHVIQDRVTGQIYLLHRVNDVQYLNAVDLYTGKVSDKVKIEKPLADHIQVYDGEIYYLVKEKEWDDTSYLYIQQF